MPTTTREGSLMSGRIPEPIVMRSSRGVAFGQNRRAIESLTIATGRDSIVSCFVNARPRSSEMRNTSK